MISISLGLGNTNKPFRERSLLVDYHLAWKPLAAAASEAPVASGIYWLGAPFNLRYGSTVSRVFYIGSALNLRKRLSSHTNTRERGNSLLQVFSQGDTSVILASFQPLPGLSDDRLRGLEYEVLYRFGVEHGFMPHGNRIPPESESTDYWSEKVRIKEPALDGTALTPDQIAEQYGLLAEQDPYPIFSSLSIDLTGGTASTGPKIYSVNFRLKPKPKIKAPKKTQRDA